MSDVTTRPHPFIEKEKNSLFDLLAVVLLLVFIGGGIT